MCFRLGVLRLFFLNQVEKPVHRRMKQISVQFVELHSGESGKARELEWSEQMTLFRTDQIDGTQIGHSSILHDPLDKCVGHSARRERVLINRVNAKESRNLDFDHVHLDDYCIDMLECAKWPHCCANRFIDNVRETESVLRWFQVLLASTKVMEYARKFLFSSHRAGCTGVDKETNRVACFKRINSEINPADGLFYVNRRWHHCFGAPRLRQWCSSPWGI